MRRQMLEATVYIGGAAAHEAASVGVGRWLLYIG